MPGRIDFVIVKGTVPDDPRFEVAASALVRAKLDAEDLAQFAVVGLQVYLSLAGLRPGADGVFPGNGVSSISRALGRSPSFAKSVISIFSEAGLLKPEGDSLYLTGFREAYAPLLEKREKDRKWRAEHRAAEAKASAGRRGDVVSTSDRQAAASMPTGDTPEAVSRTPESTSTAEAPSPPSAAGPVSTSEAAPPTNGNGAPKKRRDLRDPVELILAKRGVLIDGRGGCGRAFWRKQFRLGRSQGQADEAMADKVEASAVETFPRDVLFPRGGGGRNGRRGAPEAVAYSPEVEEHLKALEGRRA